MLLDMELDRFGQSIKSKTILRGIDDIEEAPFKFLKSLLIDPAFEHRLLHALAGAFAGFGHPPQSSSTFPTFGRDVVADNNQHA